VALGQIEAWLESPRLSLLTESESHWPELRRLLVSGAITGPRVHDARIAALCLQHGVRELWTADRDFGRFPQLKTLNPLLR
jgi:predicted nucleic acid-binding protein